MTEFIEVTPAYGKDYKNAKDAKADWNGGKDFVDTRTGRYMSKRDADADPNLSVMIRYGQNRKLTSTK